MRLLLIFLLLVPGCSPPATGRPIKPLLDFRGIIHCHSRYSHDSKGTYEEILAAARAAKVDFLCMTDHPPSADKGLPLREGWTGVHDGVLFIQGAEYSDQILAIGLREPITGKDRRETIQAIHQQGGLAIACHPELIDDWDAFAEADGMEIYNVHATLQRKVKNKAFLLEVARMLKEDPEHSFQVLQELDPEILKRWDQFNRTRSFVGIAGNDAHQNVSFFGYQLDPYPRAFKFVSTHVLAEELTQESILEALRAGRAYVAFDILSPASGNGASPSPVPREGGPPGQAKGWASAHWTCVDGTKGEDLEFGKPPRLECLGSRCRLELRVGSLPWAVFRTKDCPPY